MAPVDEKQAEAREGKAAAAMSPAQEVAAEREKNARIDAEAAKAKAERDIERDETGNGQRAAVEAVAREEGDGEDGAITQQQAMDAADWFLSPDPEEDVATRAFRLRVGKPGSPREWVYWTVRSIGRERIQQIRQQEKQQARGRRGEQPVDEVAANLRIATEGTLVPDLNENKGRHIDPADALAARFAFKPGLIDQIAAEVIAVTGYSDDDVDEIDAVKSS